MTAVVKPLGKSLIDMRDRAILLIGSAGAMRRSELASLEFPTLSRLATGRGSLWPVQDRPGRRGCGRRHHLRLQPATCPVHAWRAWVAAAGLVDGPAFCQLGNGRVTNKAHRR